MDKVTDIVKTPSALLEWTAASLETYDGWTVYKFYGSDFRKVLSFIPEASLPAAVVMYKGSNYDEDVPIRTSDISVILVAEDVSGIATATESVLPLLQKALELIDHEMYDTVLFKAASDRMQESSLQGIAVCEIIFKAEDY
ncbi:MAG: hypothetical protein A2020_16170 [Lentisphaerae bacterium GWF2_45_14]|nr:MAG: hypothetical protein A2020_16170 [Lentisphaerae bacterium GWF2_45_14]